jgi:hypothetical protein
MPNDRVDLYGMSEAEADLYLSTNYAEVLAHDTYRMGVLKWMVEAGHAEVIAGGHVVLDNFIVKGMRDSARRRFLLNRDLRDGRELARYLLHEWDDAGKVRLSVLASMPRTVGAENYHGQETGAVSWDASGRATMSFGADADLGTFITSMALFFRRTLSPEKQRAAERAFGIRGGIWRPEDERRYARAYLRWVSEGNAPLPELREAFEVFNSMATPEMLDVELTDEMRAVFRTTLDHTATRQSPGERKLDAQ